MLKKSIYFSFFIACITTFRLGATERYPENLEITDHDMLCMIVTERLEKARQDFNDLKCYKTKDQIVYHFYYLGRIHAFEELQEELWH